MSRYFLIHRLYFPAIILLIGVLALLHQFGIVPHFWRIFWPLLLITIGVLLLAERTALAGEGYLGAAWPDANSPAAQPRAIDPAAAQSTQAAVTAMVPTIPADLTGPSHGGQL